jgi:hypothetical protein
LPDKNESRRFEEIVAGLRKDPRFALPRRVPAADRVSLAIGVLLCVTAAALVAVGGVRGAILAVVPWVAGIILVLRSRAWR